jgi:uncharacterized iron-regulated membrane protein
MTDTKEKTNWQTIRKFFNDIHLWLGLGSGLIVIVVCFSGTIYVYNTELRELSSPELYHLEENITGTLLNPEQVIEKIENTKGGKVTSIKIPADKSRTWQISVKKTDPVVQEKNKTTEQRPTTYAINPYSGEEVGDITNNKNGTTEFMRTMFSLHRWLMLDRIEKPIFGELPNRKLGSYITGTATILFTLGVITGLIIWFPQKLKNWKQGLTIKWNAKWKRVNHDLHNTLAFYSLIFLFLMGVTGPQWSFEWYREGLQKTLGTYQSPDSPRPGPPKSAFPSEGTELKKLSVKDYLKEADKLLPYTGDYSITFPADSTSSITITKNKVGFFAPAASDKAYFDQYTGELISLDIFTDKPFNQRFGSSIKAVHVGDVYGKFTKLIYFFTCLVATTLPVTGTLIWLNKLKKKRKKERNATTPKKSGKNQGTL